MKRIFTSGLLLFAFVFAAVSVKAQIYYNFETALPTTNSFTNITADSVKVGNNNGTTTIRTNASVSSGYTGASGANNAGAAANTGGFTLATSTYFEITFTPTGSNSVVLTGISFGSRSTSTGPQAASIRTSVDGYTTDQATFVLSNAGTWALYSSSLSVTGIAGTPVTIRIYGYNGTGTANAGTANWRIDDLTINPLVTVPLNLLSFKGSLNSNGAAHLTWSTANEQNVNEYLIERSNDGRAFTALSTVTATNRNQSAYNFTDAKPYAGSNYYRLKMTDKDGAVKYSEIVNVVNRKGISASVFPNPVVSNLSVTHEKALKGALVRIFSADGRQISLTNVEEGAVQTSLLVSQLAKGNYLLVFENDGEKASTRFIKQ